jgi:lipoate-protein ligase A
MIIDFAHLRLENLPQEDLSYSIINFPHLEEQNQLSGSRFALFKKIYSKVIKPVAKKLLPFLIKHGTKRLQSKVKSSAKKDLIGQISKLAEKHISGSAQRKRKKKYELRM